MFLPVSFSDNNALKNILACSQKASIETKNEILFYSQHSSLASVLFLPLYFDFPVPMFHISVCTCSNSMPVSPNNYTPISQAISHHTGAYWTTRTLFVSFHPSSQSLVEFFDNFVNMLFPEIVLSIFLKHHSNTMCLARSLLSH